MNNSYIALIICSVLFFVFINLKENFVGKSATVLSDSVNRSARVFTGSWIYKSPDGSIEEYLSIEYAGQEELLNIRKLTKWRPIFPPIIRGMPPSVGHIKKYIDEPPTFRFITLGPTKIQLLSVNPTYVFPATNIEYTETLNGPALIFQGKRYHETGITF